MNPNNTSDAIDPEPGVLPHNQQRKNTMEVLILLAFLALWFILQIWVLPKMGVQT